MSIVERPEFGYSATREDGCFDLAVDGGGTTVVRVEREGYIASQRTLSPGWEVADRVEDIVVVPYDTVANEIRLDDSTSTQVAVASEVNDSSGSRRATLMFDPGTEATMELPNGDERPLTDLRVRATEFTIGATGENAMPGTLPPTSAYTYAVEFSVDQAVKAGAETVRFDKPVATYVENLNHMPVGAKVPVGYYDREAGVWKAERDGRVIKLIAESGGRALVDTDGDGTPDNTGVDDGERARLAAAYEPGQELWRVEVNHFSPYDYNYPYGLSGDAVMPPGSVTGPAQDGACDTSGSVIGCTDQSLGEVVPIQGTDLSLNYNSTRVPGRVEQRTIEVPVTPTAVPGSLESVDVDVEVAGRTTRRTFGTTPNQRYAFVWDGLDLYGRPVVGRRTATVTVTYNYALVYYATREEFDRSFANAAAIDLRRTYASGRNTAAVQRSFQVDIGINDARNAGLGGWTLDALQAYDPATRTLQLGTGERRSLATDPTLATLRRVVGTGQSGTTGDGGAALDARLTSLQAMATTSDGGLLIADASANRVRLARPGGTIQTIAGTGTYGSTGDGGAAPAARLAAPAGVAVMLDGSVLIADTGANRVRRVDTAGTIRTFAGGGTPATGIGDGGPANAARLVRPTGLAVGADGTVYVAESGADRVRRVGPDGTISTLAGTGEPGFSGDGGAAAVAQLNEPNAVAADLDGTVYIADSRNDRVRRVGADGTITTLAGGSSAANAGDGADPLNARIDTPISLAIDRQSGDLFVAGRGDGLVRQIQPGGGIATVAGGGDASPNDSQPALRTRFSNLRAVAITADGTLYYGDEGSLRVWRQTPLLEGFRGGAFAVPDSDGSLLYVFDAAGRHLRTLNAESNTTLLSFGYDARGLLTTVRDVNDNVVTIERASDGTPTAIVSPGGQHTGLTLDANGWLSKIANDAGGEFEIGSTGSGLITRFRSPAGRTSTYDFDDGGRVIAAHNAAGGVKRLERIPGPANGASVRVTGVEGDVTTYTREQLDSATASPLLQATVAGRAQSAMRTTVQRAGEKPLVTIARSDGSSTVTFPDGTVSERLNTPDPRWGMLAPVPGRSRTTTPDGRVSTAEVTRTVTLAASDDPTSLRTLTENQTVEGRTSQIRYDRAARRTESVAPTGRVTRRYYDARDRLIRLELPGSTIPREYSYDEHGSLARVAQGARETTYGYDDRQRVVSQRDGLGAEATFAYNRLDEITAMTRPGGATYRTEYDADGFETAIEVPGGPRYVHERGPLGEIASETLPDAAKTTFAHALDGASTVRRLQSGAEIATTYDALRRPISTTSSGGTTTTGWTDAHQIGSLTRTTPGGQASGVAYTYDGTLIVGGQLTGPTAATAAYDFGDDFELDGTTLEVGDDKQAIPLSRDGDGELSLIGPFSITRSTATGLTSRIDDGQRRVEFGFDGYGRETSRTGTIAGGVRFTAQREYDAENRLTRRTTTIGVGTEDLRYFYRADRRLDRVELDGAVSERYAFDVRGNRTSAEAGAKTHSASFDARDRVITLDGHAVGYDADGRLLSRPGLSLTHAATGELVKAVTSAGETSYQYDALDRRIARTTSAGTTRYYYASPAGLSPSAVRLADGTFVGLRYDAAGTLIALERGGHRYFVETDPVGTPTAVFDDSGAVVKRIRRSAYGELLTDTMPNFEVPIGFAGGIDDPQTGLTRFGLRDYDSVIGAFTAPDPAGLAGGDLNSYAYALGDPVNTSDPAGTDSLSDRFSSGAATVGGWVGDGVQSGTDWVLDALPDSACVGGSGYAGPGAGAKLCVGTDGIGGCIEVGLGAGGGVEVGADGLPGNTVGVSAEGTLGLANGGVGGAYDFDCGETTWDGSVGVGTPCGPSVSMSGDLSGSCSFEGDKKNSKTKKKSKGGGSKNKKGLEGAVKARSCYSKQW
ncbi:hypothetical protein OM076_13345 [Solirubrobacter ginsenosidimutans]|uniref:Sugar-binding protein n=1 Tax=Solirubrobacter ginsenosidimutans TaxID=490573 RepID=A0A9X3MQU1_9ACTN|nr:hypothetical protein [Solirubrobacter ginsenosidimutans]